MSITVKVQAWISGNDSNCVLILKLCSFLTNLSIAYVSLTCYELKFALYWGEITFAPPPIQPLHWTVISNSGLISIPLQPPRDSPSPLSDSEKHDPSIESLQCSLSATCNLKPISDLTHHEHEEISPRRSKCQFLCVSQIANESVIAFAFHKLIEWLWTDSITPHYDLRCSVLPRRWKVCWLLVKSLTKGLFNPSEGDRKLKSKTENRVCSKPIGTLYSSRSQTVVSGDKNSRKHTLKFPLCLECCKLGEDRQL